MRKSLSLLPGNEGQQQQGAAGKVFGVPLEEVTHAPTVSGHEVPALVKTIVDYIEEHGRLDLEGLFLVNGNAERVDWLRQRYDNGEEVDLEKEADLASAVSLLRLFLQELPEPVIPAALQSHVLQLYQDDNSEEELSRSFKYFLQQLPQVNYGLLRFLCRFLSSVASLQEERWSIGALAAVFGPDIFHLDTEGEDVREQESVSRVLAELLDNQEDLFDSDDDDVSTTNDYSSINEQITELLDDEKLEACEELPQDGEDGPSSNSPQHTLPDSPSSRSHISPLSILPGSADIIERTIRAAVEQHFFDLKTSIDKDLTGYDDEGALPSDQSTQNNEEEDQADREEEPCSPAQDTMLTLTDQHSEPALQVSATVSPRALRLSISVLMERGAFVCVSGTPCCCRVKLYVIPLMDTSACEAPEEGSGMDLDTEALVDAENNINRKDNQACDKMEQADVITFDPGAHPCDQNANTSDDNRKPPSPCQRTSVHSASHELQLNPVFPDSQWEASPPTRLPPIDFSCLHLQRESQDPVPAYKSWQDESEVGEAQLSPLAGRMVPLPLEEDAHPLLARRFLDFGHSQRFLHQDHDLSTSPTKALSAGRPRRASFGSREVSRGDPTVSHQLTKKLQHLKKKIKQFEEQFEKDRNYKPSHGDKAANPKVLKWMTDLTKIRKQIKDAKQKAETELGPLTRPRSNTLPKSFGSTLDHGPHDAAGEVKGQRPTPGETLEVIQRRVQERRQEDGWPEDVKKMTKEQLACEKTVLQKNLLHYEGLHGRPVTREERLIVKPLYDRYRLVKQMLTRASITPITVSPSSKRRNQTLQPIIEGETAHFCDEIQEEEEEGGEEEKAEGVEEEEAEEEGGESSGGEVQSSSSEVIMAFDPVTSPTHSDGPTRSKSQSQGPMRTELEEGTGKLALDLRLSSSNASSMPELLEQLWKARAEKKKLRKTIREFEEHFYKHNGRNVQKEDRVPMLEEYREYKRIKAKLRLLEVLISKQDSSKSI
ncbi:protein FAM13B [Aplochiton taeniatus]